MTPLGKVVPDLLTRIQGRQIDSDVLVNQERSVLGVGRGDQLQASPPSVFRKRLLFVAGRKSILARQPVAQSSRVGRSDRL